MLLFQSSAFRISERKGMILKTIWNWNIQVDAQSKGTKIRLNSNNIATFVIPNRAKLVYFHQYSLIMNKCLNCEISCYQTSLSLILSKIWFFLFSNYIWIKHLNLFSISVKFGVESWLNSVKWTLVFHALFLSPPDNFFSILRF